MGKGRKYDVTRATDPDARFVGVAWIAREYALGGDRVVVLGFEDAAREIWIGAAVFVNHERVGVNIDVEHLTTDQSRTTGDEHEAAHRDVGGQDRRGEQKAGAARWVRGDVEVPLARVAAFGREEGDDHAIAVVVADPPRVLERHVDAVVGAKAFALVGAALERRGRPTDGLVPVEPDARADAECRRPRA